MGVVIVDIPTSISTLCFLCCMHELNKCPDPVASMQNEVEQDSTAMLPPGVATDPEE